MWIAFLGQVRLSQGDNDAAARLFTDGLTVARRAQDPISLLVSLYDLALSSQAQGDLAGAAGHLKEGLAIGPRPETKQAPSTTSKPWQPSPASRTTRSAPCPCSPPRSQLEASSSGWLHAYVPRAPQDDAVLAALRARLDDAAYREAQAWAHRSEADGPENTYWDKDNPSLLIERHVMI